MFQDKVYQQETETKNAKTVAIDSDNLARY